MKACLMLLLLNQLCELMCKSLRFTAIDPKVGLPVGSEDWSCKFVFRIDSLDCACKLVHKSGWFSGFLLQVDKEDWFCLVFVCL